MLLILPLPPYIDLRKPLKTLEKPPYIPPYISPYNCPFYDGLCNDLIRLDKVGEGSKNPVFMRLSGHLTKKDR